MLTVDQNERQRLEMLASKNYRVLLVSGNELVTFTLENYFSGSHVTLVCVEKRQDGIKALKESSFDAVITDICHGLDDGILLRQDIRVLNAGIPILFLTPLFYWSDVRMLDQIVEDPHSYYIPENADRKFMLAKLRQVISAYQAENSLSVLKNRIARNWFLASLLQRAMLPPWVYFSTGYEFSCLYRPFSRVSGDLFQWLPLDDDRVLFIFGDVSGHGTHSALAMSAIQSFLTQVIMKDRERATRPCQIATDINNFFCQHLHNIVYMSSLIAYIDFKNNYIRYQNSGYMDVVCIESDTGEIKDINPENRGSVPLGLVKDAVYSEADNVEYHFSDSSVFFFFSDGLLDLAKDKEGNTFMDMRMCTKLASMLARDARKENKYISLPFRCLHSLEQFGYVHSQDDLSMMMVRKPTLRNNEHVFSCRVPADKKSVDEICQQASGFIADYYHDDKLSVSTELLIEEYMVNVIVHGLSEYEKLNDYIAVELCAFERELKVIIWDHGKEWNGTFLSHENADASMEQLNREMSTSGRGIPIISRIAARISRQRYCGLNETIFIIPRPATAE